MSNSNWKTFATPCHQVESRQVLVLDLLKEATEFLPIERDGLAVYAGLMIVLTSTMLEGKKSLSLLKARLCAGRASDLGTRTAGARRRKGTKPTEGNEMKLITLLACCVFGFGAALDSEAQVTSIKSKIDKVIYEKQPDGSERVVARTKGTYMRFSSGSTFFQYRLVSGDVNKAGLDRKLPTPLPDVIPVKKDSRELLNVEKTLTTGNLRHEWTFYDIQYTHPNTRPNASKPRSLTAKERLLMRVNSPRAMEPRGPTGTTK